VPRVNDERWMYRVGVWEPEYFLLKIGHLQVYIISFLERTRTNVKSYSAQLQNCTVRGGERAVFEGSDWAADSRAQGGPA